MKWKYYSLASNDPKARKQIFESLSMGAMEHTLTKKLLERFSGASGAMLAIAFESLDLDNDQLYSDPTYEGGKVLGCAPELQVDSYIDSPRWGLIEFVDNWLHSSPQSVVLCENWIATRENFLRDPRESRVLYYQEEVYHVLTHKDSGDENAIETALRESEQRWATGVCSLCEQLPEGDILSEAFFDTIVANTTHIFTPAFDGEGYLVWSHRKSIDLLIALRAQAAEKTGPLVISGCLGPRSDAYRPSEIMSVSQAWDYHAPQTETFRDTPADMIGAFTLTNIPEATGIALAAQAVAMPMAISFTVETDGRLPTGPTLREAIEAVDEASQGAPAYYLINCAHPTHFQSVLEPEAAWMKRIRGLRANSSCKSHAELDESSTLDEGNPRELAAQYRALVQEFPQITVLGGCCGTDHRHVKEMAAACSKR